MEKEKNFFEQKKQYEKPCGLDVKLRSFYFRHAEKASGDVGSDGKISQSLISASGKEASLHLGEQIEPYFDKNNIQRHIRYD